jgi:hypothetical protein
VVGPRLLAELEALAARVGVTVRAEPFGRGLLRGRGGLCWVRGSPLVVMDEALPVPDRIAVLARALAKLASEGRFDPESVHMSPAVRACLEAGGAKRAHTAAVGPRARRRPGLARTRPGQHR